MPRPLAEQTLGQLQRGDSLAPVAATLRDTLKGDTTTRRDIYPLRRSRRVRRLSDTIVAKPQRDTIVRDSLAMQDTLLVKPISKRDTTAQKQSGSPI